MQRMKRNTTREHSDKPAFSIVVVVVVVVIIIIIIIIIIMKRQFIRRSNMARVTTKKPMTRIGYNVTV